MEFLIIDDGLTSAIKNMQKDLKLFDRVERDPTTTILRFYGWAETSVTYGYAQKVFEIKRILKDQNLVISDKDIVKRPTGGGMIVHHSGDFAFSLVMPLSLFPKNSTLLNIYYNISEVVADCLQGQGLQTEIAKTDLIDIQKRNRSPICKEYPSKYELVSSEGKIIGSAQKKGKQSILQQSHLFINKIDQEKFKQDLKKSIQDIIAKNETN